MLIHSRNILLGTCLSFLLLRFAAPLLGEEGSGRQIKENAADSLSAEELADEEAYYRINILRLQRWVQNNLNALDNEALTGEVSKLIKEAGDFAKSDDYYLANVWLETVWELIRSQEETPAYAPTPDSTANRDSVDRQEAANAGLQSSVVWSREVLTGVDLWRQEFSFRIFDQDSTFLEGDGNPFSGTRLGFAYESTSGSRFVADGLVKYSRDYFSGNGYLKYDGRLRRNIWWRLEDRFEGISFFRDFDLKYWQNQSVLALFPRFGPLSIDVRDELGIRRYGEQDSTYANYVSNRFYTSLKFRFGFASLLDIGYHHILRTHKDFPQNDYSEHKWLAAWSQTAGRVLDLAFENELRFRDYRQSAPERYLQDFWEYYAWGKFELAMTRSFGTEVRGTFNRRFYDKMRGSSLADFHYWEIEPQLFLRLSSEWRFGAGFHYDEELHEDLQNSTVTDLANNAIVGNQFEDFHSVGPLVTVDFLKAGGVLFSLQQSYLLRRYPNSPTANIADFSLNADQNIYNLLLFITWDISKSWQLNVLANLDDDRSQKQESGDSQNTLLGLEVKYRF